MLRPRIHVLATGGTIESNLDAAGHKQYGHVDMSAMTGFVDDRQLTLRYERVAAIGSQNISHALWRLLARRIAQIFASDQADGIVITHGTDTLEETAFYLDLQQSLGRPVVVTGAMRPANAIDADGPANFASAVRVAAEASSSGRGVLAVLHDEIHTAGRVTKIGTGSPDAFVSWPDGVAGRLRSGLVEFEPAIAPSALSGICPTGSNVLPKVGILFAHADVDPSVVQSMAGCAGIVLAGCGDGQASDAMIGALAEASAAGVVIVRSSRVARSFVGRGAEVDDDRNGFIAAHFLNPAKARILLQLLLARGVVGPSALQEYFACA